jgi:poly-gamma-glutamate synthesis protein (capsule biosynthesis protein)
MPEVLIFGDYCIQQLFGETLAPKDVFRSVLPIINSSDLTIVNLEGPIVDKGRGIVKTGPHLKSSFDCLKLLSESGFNLVTLANNHIMDYGKRGLEATITACESVQLKSVGASLDPRQVRCPIKLNVQNTEISILNFCENEFSTIGEGAQLVNAVDPIQNSYDISKASKDSDYVVVIVHGGREYYDLPSPKFQQLLRYYVDCGADAVVAHHSH